MRIAVLDDDPIVQDLLTSTLEHHGHTCCAYSTGGTLLRDLRSETFDMLIIDWHLPDIDGPQVAQTARQMMGPLLPILFVTRRDGERDVIEGLAHGADDFMSKPLRMGELVARASALLRRAYPDAMASRLTFGPCVFAPADRSLSIGGRKLDLRSREYELALLLFRNTGRPLSRGYIRQVVWGDVSEGQSRSLDTHVSRLRIKLASDPHRTYTISSIYGKGYQLDPVHPDPDPGENAASKANT